jgi:uncharacterized coiled-coil protein SlyX
MSIAFHTLDQKTFEAVRNFWNKAPNNYAKLIQGIKYANLISNHTFTLPVAILVTQLIELWGDDDEKLKNSLTYFWLLEFHILTPDIQMEISIFFKKGFTVEWLLTLIKTTGHAPQMLTLNVIRKLIGWSYAFDWGECYKKALRLKACFYYAGYHHYHVLESTEITKQTVKYTEITPAISDLFGNIFDLYDDDKELAEALMGFHELKFQILSPEIQAEICYYMYQKERVMWIVRFMKHAGFIPELLTLNIIKQLIEWILTLPWENGKQEARKLFAMYYPAYYEIKGLESKINELNVKIERLEKKYSAQNTELNAKITEQNIKITEQNVKITALQNAETSMQQDIKVNQDMIKILVRDQQLLIDRSQQQISILSDQFHQSTIVYKQDIYALLMKIKQTNKQIGTPDIDQLSIINSPVSHPQPNPSPNPSPNPYPQSHPPQYPEPQPQSDKQ